MKYFLVFGVFLLALASCAAPRPGGKAEYSIAPREDNICPDIPCFKKRLLAHGSATASEIAVFFQGVEYKDSIIRIMNRPGTANPWYIFRKNHVSDAIINEGIDFYQEHREVLAAVSEQTGVPPEYLVAIMAIETHYGKLMGNNRVADSLYTLAFFYPRRAEFYQNELENFFLMVKEGNRAPFSYRGSFAGAMGYPQFMPSSYRKWAVSFEHEGKPDIWHNVADALASVGHYLSAHGWQKDGMVALGAEVNLTPELAEMIAGKTELKYTVKELRSRGVKLQEHLDDREKAFLFRLEIAPDVFRYYVGGNNFYAIWQYNNSRMYVMAVAEIASRIRAGL